MSDTDPKGLPDDRLEAVLGEARQAGFLGPGPLEPHLRHAAGFARIARSLERRSPESAPALLDLGSGGGLPGLVIAQLWAESSVVLLDANERRTAFLDRAVAELGLANVRVLCGRAETLGHRDDLRGSFDFVVARSFGAPAVLGECAAPFLSVGAWLVVSEPPGDSGSAAEARWPVEPLAQLGLVPGSRVQEEFSYQVLQQREPCPRQFSRRDGVPAKKPLF